jgi:hypothetical protein
MSKQSMRTFSVIFIVSLLITACDRLPSLPKLPALPNPFSGSVENTISTETPEQKSSPESDRIAIPNFTSTPLPTKTATSTNIPTATLTYTPTYTPTDTPLPTSPPVLPISKSEIRGTFESLGFTFQEGESIDGLPVEKGINNIFTLYLIGLDNDLTQVNLEFNFEGGKEVIQESVIFLTILFGFLIPEDALSTLAWVTTQLNQLLEKGTGELDLGTASVKVENTGDLFRISIQAQP